jgi:hypothetical protein
VLLSLSAHVPNILRHQLRSSGRTVGSTRSTSPAYPNRTVLAPPDSSWIHRWLAMMGAGDRRHEDGKVDEDQKPRERSFISELVPDWRPTREQVLWTLRIAIILVVVLGILTLIGLPFGITLWEWLKLLIVPAVIAAGAAWFSQQQRVRELEIAKARTQDEALEAYLDKMTELLVDQNLSARQNDIDKLKEDAVRTAAWARTKTVLRRLDGNRKGAVLRFLREADLIKKGRPVIRSLSGADLREANLQGSVLEDTALEGVVLKGAVLRGAILRGSDLRKTDLTDADLKVADLTNADLTDTQVTEEQLEAAKSLKGATMPDGKKHQD